MQVHLDASAAEASEETLHSNASAMLPESPLPDATAMRNTTMHEGGAGEEGVRERNRNGDTVIEVGSGRQTCARRRYLIENRSPMLRTHLDDLMSAREARPSRICSLDQLYSQAASLEDVFRAKVLSVAALCNGQLSARIGEGAEGRLLTVAEIQRDAGGVASIQWAPLKQVERAVVKACVLHNGDVSCVCDILRQRIAFASVKEILECLKVLTEDPNLEIVKIRNLHEPQLDAWSNAGYRDVAVMVRLVTPATQWLGVAGHVCELQLAHVDMMSLLKPDQHQRYLRFTKVALSQRRTELGISMGPGARLGYMARLLSFNDSLRSVKLLFAQVCRKVVRTCVPGSSRTLLEAPSFNAMVSRRQHSHSDMGAQGIVDYTRMLDQEGIKSNVCRAEDLDPCTQHLVTMRALAMVRVRNSLPGFFMHERLNQVRHGVRQADATMVLFTRPVGAISKAPILLIILIVGIYFGIDLFGSNGRLAVSARHNVFEARHMRFTMLETRSPEFVKDPVVLGKFGPLLHACEVAPPRGYAIELKHDVANVYMSMVSSSQVSPALFKANGYFLTTHASVGSQARDPVRWVVHRSSHETKQPQSIPERDWKLHAASGCVYGVNNLHCLPRPAIRYDLSNARDKLHHFDLTSPWFMHIGTVIVYLPIVVGCLLCAVVGIMGDTEGSRACLALNFWMPGLLEVVTALGMLLNDSDYPQTSTLLTSYWWVLGLSSMFFGVIIQFKDIWFMPYIPCHFVLTFAGLNVHNIYIIKDLGFGVPFSPAITMAFWLVFLMSRQLLLRRTLNTIRPDTDLYEMAWQTVAEQPEQLAACLQLDAITQQFDRKNRAQQRMPTRTSEANTPPSSFTSLDTASSSTLTQSFMPSHCDLAAVAGRQWIPMLLRRSTSPNQMQRISSLDQLYIQAAVLEPLFLNKVRDIAHASSGMFLLRNLPSDRTGSVDASTQDDTAANEGVVSSQRPRYVAWDHAQHLQRMTTGEGILLKSVDRIIEKLTRSLGCDVAVILDLVRQCIVFDTVTDILSAIQFMCNDPEIQVQRIKNRLSASYDASIFGYRDILVNCCITSRAAHQLRLSGHVCELQLILRQFMDHKTLEGHKRYVEFRNKRCE